MIGFFKKRKTNNMLADLLKDYTMREILLGMDKPKPVSDEKNKADATHILNYAKSEDYSVWAREVWLTVVSLIKTLTEEDLKSEDVQFYRGCLSSTLDLLQISYKAHSYMQEKAKEEKKSSSRLTDSFGMSQFNGRN